MLKVTSAFYNIKQLNSLVELTFWNALSVMYYKLGHDSSNQYLLFSCQEFLIIIEWQEM